MQAEKILSGSSLVIHEPIKVQYFIAFLFVHVVNIRFPAPIANRNSV